jgi:2-hydroxyacyl-CoA lyase 1
MRALASDASQSGVLLTWLSGTAGAAGYMTGRPGVCLAVSGPGVVHALAGLGNAWANCWPMVLLGGATHTDNAEMGGFQV